MGHLDLWSWSAYWKLNCFDLILSQVLRADCSSNGGLSTAVDAFLGMDGSDLPVEICHTRTLPPSLTLQDAASKIKEEVEQLKLSPPHSRTGFLRFQVNALKVKTLYQTES